MLRAVLHLTVMFCLQQQSDGRREGAPERGEGEQRGRGRGEERQQHRGGTGGGPGGAGDGGDRGGRGGGELRGGGSAVAGGLRGGWPQPSHHALGGAQSAHRRAGEAGRGEEGEEDEGEPILRHCGFLIPPPFS